MPSKHGNWEAEISGRGVTFEDEEGRGEIEEKQKRRSGKIPGGRVEIYRTPGKSCREHTETERGIGVMEPWEDGFPEAAHQLGKCWRDGLGVFPDDEQAELWFRRGAEAGYDFSQYALGRLLETQKRMVEAVIWYEKAAAQGNPAAACQLGKLYLQGAGSKDVPKALNILQPPPGQPISPIHSG
ncbi:MAG: tetratricopeptide repeat protein [Clostridia bacterium]